MMTRLAALMLVLTLALSACSDDGNDTEIPSELEVTVEDYSAVIAVPPGFVFEPGSEVLREGLGAPMRDGDTVLMRIYSMEIETGNVLLDTYSSLPDVWQLDAPTVGADIYNALINQNLGSRILLQSETANGAVATVIETHPVRAIGNPSETSVPLGELTLADDGHPQFTVDLDAEFPSELSVFTTIFGSDEQIVVGDELLLQYVLIEWPSGEVVESTWEDNMVPIQIGAGDGNELARSMVEVPGRSQVMLIVPVQNGQAESEAMAHDHIFIIDIIWVQPRGTSAEEEESLDSDSTNETADEPSEDASPDSEGDS